jgi:hypothetical protein
VIPDLIIFLQVVGHLDGTDTNLGYSAIGSGTLEIKSRQQRTFKQECSALTVAVCRYAGWVNVD